MFITQNQLRCLVLASLTAATSCKSNLAARLIGQPTKAEPTGHHEPANEAHSDHGGSLGEENSSSIQGTYLASVAPIVTTPVIPQCKPQRNAPSGQLAASYFEEMQACEVGLPPQLTQSSHEGKLDENGDCNLGAVKSTDVVCHHHSGYEFTARDSRPADARDTIEVHCIAFRLVDGKRQLTPIVFGTQLVCAAGSMPGATASHGGHENSCGSRIPEIFQDVQSCDMRCCRNGTLTKANPGTAVRPTFAVCANANREVDCAGILEGMHAHAAHRPHDRVGPESIYPKRGRQAVSSRRSSEPPSSGLMHVIDKGGRPEPEPEW